MDSDDSDTNNKNRPKSGDQSKKEVKIDYPVKWLKNKHSFTVAGSEFIVDERYEYIKQIGVGAKLNLFLFFYAIKKQIVMSQ